MPYKDKEKEKKHRRQYYHKKKERILEQQARYREENREKIRAKQREYYQKNIETRTAHSRKWKQELRELLMEELGRKCVICGKTPSDPTALFFHEIHGHPHDCRTLKYVYEHKEDFVPMCMVCHRTLHYLLKYLKGFMKYVNLIMSN